MKKTAFDKIVVGFVFLVIIIFSVLIFYTIHSTKKKLYSETENELNTISYMIANTYISEYASGAISTESLKEQLLGMSSHGGFDIWLTDSDGYLIYSPKQENPSDTENEVVITQDISKYINTNLLRSNQLIEDTMNGFYSSKYMCMTFPVFSDNKYFGTLILCHNMDFQKQVTRDILNSTYTPFLVLVIISLLALMLISNSMLKPLRQIIRTSKSYAAGNFNARTNITVKNEFGELAKYIDEMADELSRSNEYRKAFISNISHDFRSPLTSIKGYIEAMLDGTIPPEKYEKYLNTVLTETKRLTKLTQGLLELNNFDSFDLQLDKSNFDIKDVVTATINTFEGRCQDKGIYLKGSYLTDDCIVYADRTKIQQVIYNLVDNAIKFTPEGREITVQLTEKNEKIVVSVKDEGVGIPKESIKKVFDRFYKTDPSRGKDKTGTGLGLAITKEIIKAHGEHITLTSEVNQGSEFVFSLPKQKEMQVPIKPVHTPKPEDPFENSKFKIKRDK